MLQQLLALFPSHTHPLILVSDPDGLLKDEAILSALIDLKKPLMNSGQDSAICGWRDECQCADGGVGESTAETKIRVNPPLSPSGFAISPKCDDSAVGFGGE